MYLSPLLFIANDTGFPFIAAKENFLLNPVRLKKKRGSEFKEKY